MNIKPPRISWLGMIAIILAVTALGAASKPERMKTYMNKVQRLAIEFQSSEGKYLGFIRKITEPNRPAKYECYFDKLGGNCKYLNVNFQAKQVIYRIESQWCVSMKEETCPDEPLVQYDCPVSYSVIEPYMATFDDVPIPVITCKALH